MKIKIGTALYVAGLCISLMFSCAIAGGGAACMITEGVSFKYVLITIVSIIIAFTSFESFYHIFDDPVNIEVVYGTQPKSEAAEQSNHVDNDATYGGMVIPKTWDEFRSNGLLWFINTILHLFGYAIVLDVDQDTVKQAYPARVRYRGFDGEINSEGYIKLSKYMKDHIDELVEEANE